MTTVVLTLETGAELGTSEGTEVGVSDEAGGAGMTVVPEVRQVVVSTVAV